MMDSLDKVRHQINSGDREGARLALVELLEGDPDSVDAWSLLAILLPDPADQAECYRQILRVDPGNRQAAAWLDALSRELPRSSADAAPVDRQVEDTQGQGPRSGTGDVNKLLRELEQRDLGETAVRRAGGAEMISSARTDLPTPPAEAPNRSEFWDRILGQGEGGVMEAGMDELGFDLGDASVQPGSLSPGNILRMAGGPLPPEERRKCHNCGAVVSRSEVRCSWCSAPLPGTGES